MCELLRMAYSTATRKILAEVCKFLNGADASDINRLSDKLRDCLPDEADRAHARYVMREVARRL